MTLTIAHKDISLANNLAGSVGMSLRMGAQTEKLIDEAIAAGLGELDVSGMHEAIKLPK
jgi:3-hydroxyisobutyrate dehydrogenase-like beta-hydroxyacid dehydrogenase